MSTGHRSRKKQQRKIIQEEKTFLVGQVVWVKLKGHPIWPAKVEQEPSDNTKQKYFVKYYNHKDYSFVSSAMLYDFAEEYQKWAPNHLGESMKDRAIKAALENLTET